MQVRIELAMTVVDSPETALEEDRAALEVEKFLEQLKVGTLNEVPKLAAYEIERELGRGTFGVVYLARHKQSGLRVALKIMRPKVAVDEYMRKVFQREIEIAKELHHSSPK
jgi:serine/threonine protein kinase